MGKGSHTHTHPLGLLCLETTVGGGTGQEPLPALPLLGRARRFARPRLRLLLRRCWQMGPGPGVSGKGDCSFPGANLLPLERRPGLQQGFCWSRTGAGFDAQELRIQQGVLNTGESEPPTLYRAGTEVLLGPASLQAHPCCVPHPPQAFLHCSVCAYGKEGCDTTPRGLGCCWACGGSCWSPC